MEDPCDLYYVHAFLNTDFSGFLERPQVRYAEYIAFVAWLINILG